MNTFTLRRILSNGSVEFKTVSYDDEQKQISQLFHNELINTKIKEILLGHTKELALKYFPEDDSKPELLHIMVDFDQYKYYRPTILFNGTDFKEEKELIPIIQLKVNEYRIHPSNYI